MRGFSASALALSIIILVVHVAREAVDIWTLPSFLIAAVNLATFLLFNGRARRTQFSDQDAQARLPGWLGRGSRLQLTVAAYSVVQAVLITSVIALDSRTDADHYLAIGFAFPFCLCIIAAELRLHFPCFCLAAALVSAFWLAETTALRALFLESRFGPPPSPPLPHRRPPPGPSAAAMPAQ